MADGAEELVMPGAQGDGPSDLRVSNGTVATATGSTLGSTSTVPGGFMSAHPSESAMGNGSGAQPDSLTEPNTAVGAIADSAPTTEPVSVPPAEKALDASLPQPQPEVPVSSTVSQASAELPAPVEATSAVSPAPAVSEASTGGPAPVGGTDSMKSEQSPVEPVSQVGPAPIDTAPAQDPQVRQVTPRSDAAALTPENAQSQQPKIPGPSKWERLKEKLHLNIGTPPPAPPKPI